MWVVPRGGRWWLRRAPAVGPGPGAQQRLCGHVRSLTPTGLGWEAGPAADSGPSTMTARQPAVAFAAAASGPSSRPHLPSGSARRPSLPPLLFVTVSSMATAAADPSRSLRPPRETPSGPPVPGLWPSAVAMAAARTRVTPSPSSAVGPDLSPLPHRRNGDDSVQLPASSRTLSRQPQRSPSP